LKIWKDLSKLLKHNEYCLTRQRFFKWKKKKKNKRIKKKKKQLRIKDKKMINFLYHSINKKLYTWIINVESNIVTKINNK